MKNISFIIGVLIIGVACPSCARQPYNPTNSSIQVQTDRDHCTKYDHDADAELYNDLAKSAGPRPRGAAALLTGFFEGLAHGSRSKSRLCRQKLLQEVE
jgi:hypothetical protein